MDSESFMDSNCGRHYHAAWNSELKRRHMLLCLPTFHYLYFHAMLIYLCLFISLFSLLSSLRIILLLLYCTPIMCMKSALVIIWLVYIYILFYNFFFYYFLHCRTIFSFGVLSFNSTWVYNISLEPQDDTGINMDWWSISREQNRTDLSR